MDDDDDPDSSNKIPVLENIVDLEVKNFSYSKYLKKMKDFGYYVKDILEHEIDEIKRYIEPTPLTDKYIEYASLKGIPKYFGVI